MYQQATATYSTQSQQTQWHTPTTSNVKSSEEQLALHYFKNVLQQLYPLSDATLLNTIHEVVVTQPGAFRFGELVWMDCF